MFKATILQSIFTQKEINKPLNQKKDKVELVPGEYSFHESFRSAFEALPNYVLIAKEEVKKVKDEKTK